MPPIRKGDGTPVAPKGISQVRTGDGRILFDGPAIPDSVVTRPEDDDTVDRSGESGLEIETKAEWPSIGARISSNTSGVTDAYLREDDGSLIDNVDISDLSSGDAFTFDDVDLNPDTKYRITVDADGDGFTNGFRSGETDYPYESDDVHITARLFEGGEPEDQGVIAVNDIGNVGFD